MSGIASFSIIYNGYSNDSCIIRDRGAARVQWRRSLGASPLQFKEDLANALSQSGSISQTSTNADWPALQADYTFLMSCDLIETCRSLNGEISGDFTAQRGLGDNSPGLIDATKSVNQSINSNGNDDVEPSTPGIISIISIFCFIP